MLVFLFSFLFFFLTEGLSLPSKNADENELKIAFSKFMVKFEKKYESEQEQAIRFKHFVRNVMESHRLNSLRKEEWSAKFGINHPFSDLSADEFRQQKLMKRRPPVTISQLKHAEPFDRVETLARLGGEKAASSLPSQFSWVTKGKTTPIKNQGQCGSCWAFSATENVESVWIIAGRANASDLRLAPQQLVDCSDYDLGCDGGNPPFAFDSVIDEGGMESESSYPYRGNTGSCELDPSKIVAKIDGYKFGNFPFYENEMQESLVAWAPLSVCVDASNWQNYESGTMTADQCTPWHIDLLDHCVSLVGYNFTASPPYWIVRNSWSSSWGLDGYIHLEHGENTCGIALETSSSYLK